MELVDNNDCWMLSEKQRAAVKKKDGWTECHLVLDTLNLTAATVSEMRLTPLFSSEPMKL